MKKINNCLTISNQVVLKSSRMSRYKIMEYERNTYVLNLLPHWYSFFWGVLLNFIPARFYKLENISEPYYNKKSWKESGLGMGAIAGIITSFSTIIRIFSQRIGSLDIAMWIKFTFVLIPFIIIFYLYKY